MTAFDLNQLPEHFARARVLCVGDLMLDTYVYGEVQRISPEAPIPVLKVVREEQTLGGAGNVARNLHTLGVRGIFVGLVGRDVKGTLVHEEFAKSFHVVPSLIEDPSRPTISKVRFVAHQQQMLRVDREKNIPISEDIERECLRRVQEALPTVNVMILSDYAKGLLTPSLTQKLLAMAKIAKVPVVVDPKGQDFQKYRGAFLLTPNKRELAEAVDHPIDDDESLIAAARSLIEKCDLSYMLVTRSAEGMTLVPKEGQPLHVHAKAREVFDVSGAGDTVIATLASCLAADMDLSQAVELANLAGSVVVEKIGTAPIHVHELLSAAHHQEIERSEDKIFDREQIKEQAQKWRFLGKKIVFTNGCFDLLHTGHVQALKEARAQGDALVLGLNSDVSVRRLKGDTRPINHEMARATVLAALESVDAVVIFGEDTPETLIHDVRPDVLVKSGDYTIDQVVGGDFVQANGGRVHIAGFVDGFSTTSTYKKIQET